MIKKFLLPILCVFLFLSCTGPTDPASVKARLLADEDFKGYIVAQKQKLATGGTNAAAEQKSFKHFQRLYKNYISKNLVTTQQFNEIVKEEMDK